MEWKSAITDAKGSEIRIRGYALEELVGKLSYAQMLHLLLKGELPSPEEHIAVDALLVAVSDRGVASPPALVARQAVAAGASLNNAMAAAILSLSEDKGLVIEACMNCLLETMDKVAEQQLPIEEAAMQFVVQKIEAGERLPGYGTPGQEPDRVAQTLLDLVEGLNLPLAGAIQVARALEIALTAHLDRHIPINLHGAVAAALCELDFPPEVGNAFFLMGRIPGLVAHGMEERLRQEPGRLIEPSRASYDGPAPRELF